MIVLHRVALEEPLLEQLASLTHLVAAEGIGNPQVSRARSLWRARNNVRHALRDSLSLFAAGRGRCMYCGDNEGTDIDHYDPVVHAPLLTFTWTNHLLACSACNSHHKRDSFPTSADGIPLLLDPTRDDPFEHMALALTVGRYSPLTARGRATIETCSLNRDLLARGRQTAFDTLSELIEAWHKISRSGDSVRAGGIIRALREQPFADVTHAMLRYCENPGAEEVFAGHEYVLPILRAPEFRQVLFS